MTTRQQRDKVQRVIIWLKSLIVFLFSHVGLCALVIAYTMLGAVVFRAIEGQQERDTNQMIRDYRRKTVDAMWDATFDHDVKFDTIQWSKKCTDAIYEFKQLLVTTIQRKGYDAMHYQENSQWTFSGAFFYSLTVITTIGYGNIACRTYFGKGLTILYAIIGIPIMLLFLTNIGDVLAKCFRVMYRKSVKLKMQSVLWHKRRKIEGLRKKVSDKKQKLTQPLSLRTASSSSSAASRKRTKRSHSALHDDNHNPRIQYYRSRITLPVSRGGSFSTGTAGNYDNLAMEQMRVEALFRQYELDELEFRENMEEKLEKINVPLWLVLLTMVGYLIAGGVLFHIWEKWDFEDAFYFCYVSLATIGFGDLFPGSSLVDDDSSAQKNLVITSFYLLFGMALIAMCFNLAQEEVVTTVTQLAIRIGIVRIDAFDDNENDENEETNE